MQDLKDLSLNQDFAVSPSALNVYSRRALPVSMHWVCAVSNRAYQMVPVARGPIPHHAEKSFPYLRKSRSPDLDPFPFRAAAKGFILKILSSWKSCFRIASMQRGRNLIIFFARKT